VGESEVTPVMTCVAFTANFGASGATGANVYPIVGITVGLGLGLDVG
jgi:hypothetical protein